MDIKEVNELSLLDERKHWWIRTRFHYIDKALSYSSSANLNILEYGCGTGQNLWYLRNEAKQKLKVSKSLGIDPELSTNFKTDWATENDHFSSSLSETLKDANLLLAMDVLEHIEEDQAALDSWVKNLESGSVLLLTVPAFQSLWSYHDDFLDHKRRYTKEQLEELAKKSGLETLKLTYAFSYLYPIVFIVRKLFSSKKSKTDLKLPHPIINTIFRTLGFIESLFGGFPLFGTSVIGIFRKP